MMEDRKVTAILLAAGSGTRFGADGNKVYVQAGGQPILQYSIDVLERHPAIDEWILVVRDGEQDPARHLRMTKKWKLVVGGETRQESVLHGISEAAGGIVLIHDSARPMIREEYITGCLEAMRDVPGCSIAVRSKDTVKICDENNLVLQTTERSRTWIIQTPQCFRRDVLLAAHERFGDRPDITDDCMLLELSGEPVKLVEGDYTNIKVTTPEDLGTAEMFLKEESAAHGN